MPHWRDLHKDLKEMGRSHGTERNSVPDSGNSSAKTPKWVCAWSAGGLRSNTEGGLGRSSRKQGQEGPRATSYGASRTLDIGFDSQRNGEPRRIRKRGVRDWT